MGLFNTLKNLFRGKIRDLDNSIKNQELEGELGLEDGKAKVKESKHKLAKIMTNTNLLERQLKDAKVNEGKYQTIVDGALEAGNEDHYNIAIGKLEDATKQVKAFTKQVDENQKIENRLRADIQKYENAINSAASGLNTLKARNESAEIRKEMAADSEALNGENSALGKLKAFEEHVNSNEAEAEAYEEIASAGAEVQNLEDTYINSSSKPSFAEAMKAKKEEAKNTKK